MSQSKVYTAIGLMSGTSMDGVDAAILKTDGIDYLEADESITVPYDDATRQQIVDAIAGRGDRDLLSRILTLRHAEAVKALLQQANLSAKEIDLVGFHGQTVEHRPHDGITVQLGDGALLAQETGIDVVCDFRTADVKAGGEGAPVAPVYHRAMTAKIKKPTAIVNIGGVSNVTWLGENGEMLAFDTGPGNALMDDAVYQVTGKPCDENGALASKGRTDEILLLQMLSHPYFDRTPPKSLDRNDFAKSLPDMSALSLEDKLATLAAFTSSSIAKAAKYFPQKVETWYIAGGGRHNQILMRLLEKHTESSVKSVEALGHDGDSLEAEAFAYLAVRSKAGLPLTFSTTTGISKPELRGGRFCAA